MSASVETVVKSFKNNRVGLKGIISSPTNFQGGVLQTMNMKIRYEKGQKEIGVSLIISVQVTHNNVTFHHILIA